MCVQVLFPLSLAAHSNWIRCRSGSKYQLPVSQQESGMAVYDEDFHEFLRQLHLSDEVRDALLQNGYDCTLTFGLASSSKQMHDQHIQKFLPLGETDLTSPTCARIRALWSKCNTLRTTTPIPTAQTMPPTPATTPSASQPNATSNWHETLPPKLSIDDMETMKTQFGKNYPGEVLDAHSTPAVRLWSLVHQQKVNKHIKYIPIQLRLSEHQYSAMIETRSSKPLRSEIQLLSQLCWDDTPEIDINSVRFSRDWLHKTSTVLRNAYSGMCHLQAFKAFDAKISEHTSPQLDNELGLRHVMAQKFFSADKKIWNAISHLYSRGTWTFEECLNEMTVVRSDVSSLLQPGPRIPKQLPPLRDGKGKEKVKDITKAPSITREVAREKPKDQLLTRNQIGAHGVSTTISVWHYVRNSMQESASVVQSATTMMDALFVSAMDVRVCKTAQPRITRDPPDFRQPPQVTQQKMLAW